MDTNQWTQETGEANKVSMAEIGSRPGVMERKVRPQKDQALNCPRCHSTNTKFCYYNNYSLTQPRYFCKTCRRYWTEGGTLRNVPVGGGSRKNKRSTTTAFNSSASTHKIPDLNPSNLPDQFSSRNPKIHEGHDLNLGFTTLQEYPGPNCQFFELPKTESGSQLKSSSPSSATSTPFAALEMLRTTGIASRGMNPFVPNPAPDLNSLYTSGFTFQDLKPAVSFSVDGIGNRYGSSGVQENSGRLVFPFGAMKQLSAGTSEVDQNKGHQNSNGFWTGMLGGGAW